MQFLSFFLVYSFTHLERVAASDLYVGSGGSVGTWKRAAVRASLEKPRPAAPAFVDPCSKLFASGSPSEADDNRPCLFLCSVCIFLFFTCVFFSFFSPFLCDFGGTVSRALALCGFRKACYESVKSNFAILI